MIRRGPSLIRVAATTAVVAGTATAVSGGMRNRQAQKAQAQQAAAAPAPSQPGSLGDLGLHQPAQATGRPEESGHSH